MTAILKPGFSGITLPQAHSVSRLRQAFVGYGQALPGLLVVDPPSSPCSSASPLSVMNNWGCERRCRGSSARESAKNDPSRTTNHPRFCVKARAWAAVQTRPGQIPCNRAVCKSPEPKKCLFRRLLACCRGSALPVRSPREQPALPAAVPGRARTKRTCRGTRGQARFVPRGRLGLSQNQGRLASRQWSVDPQRRFHNVVLVESSSCLRRCFRVRRVEQREAQMPAGAVCRHRGLHFRWRAASIVLSVSQVSSTYRAVPLPLARGSRSGQASDCFRAGLTSS